jgi:DNA-directed RNA polymerase subunit RPC12/RpoP
MAENDDESIVKRLGHTEYKSDKVKKIDHLGQVVICIFLAVVFFNVNKSSDVLLEEIKTVAPTVVHDTLLMPAPKIYRCWQCKKELLDVSRGPVICCGYEYKIINGELTAKKLGE